MSPPRDRRIRIASWPPSDARHPYLERFYEALATHGVGHVPDLPARWGALSRVVPPIDVWHMHWPDTYWRAKGPTLARQAIRVARLGALIARARHAGIRVVWTVDETARDGGTGAADRIGFRMLHDAVDLRIFTSDWARSAGVQRYGSAPDTVVVPLGRHPTTPDAAPRAEIRRALGVPPDCRVLLCFGDLSRANGFDVALNALRHLPADGFRLLIAGRPMPPYGDELVAATASRRNVHLVASEIDKQHLGDLLCASDVVVFPYRSVTESSALLHALSYGRGVVATDLPYFREVLSGAPEASTFAPPDDAPGLARAIERLLAVPADRRERAARSVADRLPWDRLVVPFAAWLRRQRWSELPARQLLPQMLVRPEHQSHQHLPSARFGEAVGRREEDVRRREIPRQGVHVEEGLQ